ncbi:MAG TPA: hypothetical protein VNK44_08040, partial [Candidatus Nitrosotenuis sp.]|nr:hypothetical protein [Candidatus Nitrosotenuis sp.]
TKTATKTLTENLGITDTLTKTATKSLTENLGITDNTARTSTRSLTEKLGIKDTINFKGGVKIEARDLSNNLVPGASYTITPNPNGGISSFVAVDGGANDNDGHSNGRVIVNSLPFGTYNFTMTIIPSTYNVLGNSTIYEAHRTQLNGTSVFRVASQSINLTTIPPTVITSAPSLNSTIYNTWTTSFTATVVNGSSTNTITAVNQLPPIISVGNSTSQLNEAIMRQASIKLNTAFSSQTSSQHIINTLGIMNYSVPTSPQTTSVIPSIVTAPSGNSPQFTATPPLNHIIPGQEIVIPVETVLLPSYGGLKQLKIKSLDGKSPVGNAPNDWFVIETAPTIPGSLGTTGIQQSNINLFVDVSYQYEVNGMGFNWNDPNNLVPKPSLQLRVAKSSSVVSDSNGCPVMTPYILNGGTWTNTGVTITSISPVDANSCDLEMTVPHFSEFALASTPTSTGSGSSGSSGSSPSGTSGTSGTGGAGGGGGGTAGGTGFGGRLVSPVIIYEISYDVCEQNMVRIIAGVIGTDAPAPHVKLRTPLKEVYSATLAQYQPYAEANKILPISRYVYEAPLDPKLNFFIVTAEQIGGRAAVTATYMVSIEDCRNTIIVNTMTDIGQTGVEPTPETGRPNIFDVKFQINQNKPTAATTVNQFLEPKDHFKVSAIVDSPSSLRRVELRVNVAGGNFSNYAAVKMNVEPLQNITSAYVVSAELPSSFLQAPAIVYWIHAINNDEKIQSSERYVIGVKPSYELNAKIELDTPPSKAQGTTYRPTAYIYNTGERQLFGTVSLLVDGKIMYTSPEQLFNKGQSVVNLEWYIPETGGETKYKVNAQLNLYDKNISTTQTTLNTFQATKTFSISQPIAAVSITDDKETIARVGLMYSSDNNPALHYRVVAPDGTCVIGKSDSCLIKDSTAANRGNTMSVEIDGQIYRVRYSGSNNPLERFSITSVDPITGTWSVTLESDMGAIPEAQALADVSLKMKYRPTYTNLVTVASE